MQPKHGYEVTFSTSQHGSGDLVICCAANNPDEAVDYARQNAASAGYRKGLKLIKIVRYA